jgi:chemotaxis protein MotB
MRRWWWLVEAALALSIASGCAHSEDEWQQKLHEAEDLKSKLEHAEAQAKKAKGEHDSASERLAKLEQDLKTAGIDVAAMNASVEQQARAMDDYRRRVELLAAQKKRHDLLKTKLAPLAKQGVAVSVAGNRLAIVLDGDALFDAKSDSLRREGRALLLEVAKVIHAEPQLAARSWQIAAHLDPQKGRDPWLASVTRAREILAALIAPADRNGGGLAPARLSAAGFGDADYDGAASGPKPRAASGGADPLSSNDSPEGKQKNRRVELVIVPAADELVDLRALAKEP